MKTSPYSIDLREKVIKYLEAGNSQRDAARVFKLSKTTVNRWHVRYKREGHFRARKREGSKPRIEIERFKKYVEAHPNARVEDIGKAFGMSFGGAMYWIKKLGFSYKKKAFTYVEASEEKKLEYIGSIMPIDKDKLVYIDESGIDMNICKDRGWGMKGIPLKGKKSGKYYQRTNIVAVD